MKKLLTFLTLLTLSIGVGWAAEETVDFSAQGYSNQQEITSYTGTNFTVTFSQGSASNPCKYFSSGTAIRCYAGSQFAVKSKSSTENITSIVITFGSSDGTNEITSSPATYSNGTWTGNAESVVFTIGGSSGNRRIKALTVTTGGGTTPTTYSITGTGTQTGGSVTASATSNITEGTSITITATPSTGYELSNLTVDGNDVTSSVNSSYEYTFNMPEHDVAVSATFTEQQASTDQYELVTDVSQLAAGDKIIIASTATSGSGYAMSATQASNNRPGTSVNIANSIITPDNSVQIITLEKDGDNWLFNVGGGYLYAASSSSNYLRTEATPDANAEASISISSNAATITFKGTNTRNLLRYNSSSHLFSCYASGQQPVFIYKKVEQTQSSDVYIVGQVNGHDSDPWVSTEGVKMTYNSTNDNYAANIYCDGMKNGNDDGYSYFLFAKSLPFSWDNTSNLYGSGADGSYWPISGLSGESAFDEEIPLYEGSKNVYRLPAGLYTVTVDLDYTHQYTTKSVKVTKRDVTLNVTNSATFADTKNVTMTSNLTELGGKIWYTTDGSDPRTQSNTNRHEYTEQISLDATTTIKAVAVLGCIYSDVVEKTYTKTPAAPVITPASCTFSEPFQVTITAESGATIYYTTDGSDPTNESTQYNGPFTVSATTTVKAIAYVGEAYSSVTTATYTYSNVQPSTGDFVLVTSADQLVAGNEYIIMSYDNDNDYAMGSISNTRGYPVTDFTLNGTIGVSGSTVSAGTTVNVLTLGGTTGAWTLQQSDNKYIVTAASGTSIDTEGSACNLVITIGSDYAANIQNSATTDTRQIRYATAGYFRNYGTSQANTNDVYLYTRASNAVQNPVFSPVPGIYNVDIDVTISCATDGATIYYTTDGTDPTATTGTQYTGEIMVSESTTFKAIAVKDGNTSSVVTAAYTIQKSTDIATVTLTYSEPFTAGIGDFTINNVSGFSPVWSLDGNYGVKGTSYSNGTNYAAVSRLVSPIIDMTGSVQPELSFSHQINKYFTDPTTQCQVFIRETSNGTSGTWVQIPITFSDPVAAGGWTNDVVDIDLTDINGVSYADKKVQISFLYTNPTAGTGAGTWEIQNFVVADNSEYRMVNNIAEFLALENGTKAKFKNPVTVLYDYAQYSSNSYHEYIWVKDESGYMQFFLQPTLNSSTESTIDPKAAYYENGDIIPAGFVVVKNYYENGKYVQAYSTEALDAGFEPATQKGLADPDHYEFSTLNALTLSDADIAANCNRYITVEKVKIASKSSKNFTFADENGTVNACVGYNKYNGDGSLLKDGTTSADVTVPAVSNTTYYNVKGIIQIWQGGWELMPIEFTEWKADEVTLRKLCADGVKNNEYKISNNLMGVYASADGTKLWVKDDDGQAIVKYAPNDEYPNNFAIEAEGNTRLDQQYYDQSNWCEIQLTGTNAASFVGKIIKGGSIQGTFTNKTNPTMTGVTLTNDNIYSDGSYEPNYYIPANFFGSQSCNTSEQHGGFFFMTPKPQEYVQIVWAIWDREHEQFIMSTDPNRNSHMFEGGFSISFDYNNGVSSYAQIQDGYGYNFTAIIKKTESKDASYIVYPLDLNEGIDPATAIESVVAGNGEVKSIKYVNVAGMVSDVPFQGVNIVVTEYTDGSRTTTKMLRK